MGHPVPHKEAKRALLGGAQYCRSELPFPEDILGAGVEWEESLTIKPLPMLQFFTF